MEQMFSTVYVVITNFSDNHRLVLNSKCSYLLDIIVLIYFLV
jgi:hypothetical protein